MRIVTNTTPLLSALTGVGYYTYNLSRALARLAPRNSYKYYYGYFSRRLFTGKDTGILYEVMELVKKIPLADRLARHAVKRLASFWPGTFDLYFEPNFIPVGIKSGRTVVTVHDFSFILYPQWHPKARIEHFEKYFWERLGRADRIIVPCDFVRREAVETYGLPGEKVRVVNYGYDSSVFAPCRDAEARAVRKRFSVPDKFILFVGAMEPRKNLAGLLKAYSSLGPELRAEFKLVLAGFKGWENGEIMALLDAVKGDVVYLGYLASEELRALYSSAALFVYPSYYEGFGFPPLEAMACGCPVVVSHAASLPEVCGDAARYVDPLDVQSIARGIREVAQDERLRRAMRAAGLERAKRFSWKRSAEEHLKVFEEACGALPAR